MDSINNFFSDVRQAAERKWQKCSVTLALHDNGSNDFG